VLSGGGIAFAAPRYSDWSTPINLGPTVNSSLADQGVAISKDGLSLYFQSQRSGGQGGYDIWVSQRANKDDPWGLPTNLGAMINTVENERVPNFSRDGHWMFFASNRPGSLGMDDIWASWRPQVHDDFGWQTPVPLGPNINTPFQDGAMAFSENEEGGPPLLYFSSDRPGGMGGTDIYVSTQQPDGSWGPATTVVELNSSVEDARPAIRHDGLEIFFQSTRPGGFGLRDIWTSTRNSTADAWSTPENLGPLVNSTSTEVQPAISSDGKTMIFARYPSTTVALADLYVTTRTKEEGKP
jgi:Tol biopolymer transport system component